MKRFFLAAFLDVDRKTSSEGHNISGLDGLRGLAVLIVMASHTSAFGLWGQGSLGVFLFFVLSGFVLTVPFATHPERILSWPAIGRFFTNRALRILPAYVAVTLYLVWWIDTPASAAPGWITTHLTFMGGWNHLWSVVEEARFYVLFPIIVAGLALLPGRLSRMAYLVCVIAIARHYETTARVDMMNGTTVKFYFWFFAAGMLACLIHAATADRLTGKSIFAAIGGAIVAFVFFSSDANLSTIWMTSIFGHRPEGFSLNGWHNEPLWCGLFAVLLLCAACTPTLLAWWPMRHIGLLSYGLYLFHIPVAAALQPWKLEGAPLFLAVMGGTYVVAVASYTLVERPFLRLKPSRSTQLAPPELVSIETGMTLPDEAAS